MLKSMTKEQKVQVFAWGLTATATAVAVIAWGETYGWRMSRLSIYQLFPLLGLVAFSVMWSHYVVGVTRRLLGVEKAAVALYFEVTAAVVLGAILLHPGLLAWQLWLDGFGLPPGSEWNYVEPAARWAILFGFTALSLFLLFEFRRFYDKRPWWKYVEYLSDGAMVLIYFHALRLGGTLQIGWFRAIWYFYGLTFFGSLVYIYYQKRRQLLSD
jgi:hypothetical protein